jgi:hypothetical protein
LMDRVEERVDLVGLEPRRYIRVVNSGFLYVSHSFINTLLRRTVEPYFNSGCLSWIHEFG